MENQKHNLKRQLRKNRGGEKALRLLLCLLTILIYTYFSHQWGIFFFLILINTEMQYLSAPKHIEIPLLLSVFQSAAHATATASLGTLAGKGPRKHNSTVSLWLFFLLINIFLSCTIKQTAFHLSRWHSNNQVQNSCSQVNICPFPFTCPAVKESLNQSSSLLHLENIF